jgi:hypothetical protein
MSLKPLEDALARAVKAAAIAQANLITAQERLGIQATPLFYTAAEMRAVMRERDEREQQNRLAIVEACRVTHAPTKQELADQERRRNSPPLTRENLAWLDLVCRAHEIVQADKTKKETVAPDRHGKVVELPTDAAARAIIRAGRTRRGENT